MPWLAKAYLGLIAAGTLAGVPLLRHLRFPWWYVVGRSAAQLGLCVPVVAYWCPGIRESLGLWILVFMANGFAWDVVCLGGEISHVLQHELTRTEEELADLSPEERAAVTGAAEFASMLLVLVVAVPAYVIGVLACLRAT